MVEVLVSASCDARVSGKPRALRSRGAWAAVALATLATGCTNRVVVPAPDSIPTFQLYRDHSSVEVRYTNDEAPEDASARTMSAVTDGLSEALRARAARPPAYPARFHAIVTIDAPSWWWSSIWSTIDTRVELTLDIAGQVFRGVGTGSVALGLFPAFKHESTTRDSLLVATQQALQDARPVPAWPPPPYPFPPPAAPPPPVPPARAP